MTYRTIIKTGIALAALFLSTGASAQQIVMEKAVVGAGGVQATNGQTVMQATVGQTVTGNATNGTTTMQYGFWTSDAAPVVDGVHVTANFSTQVKSFDVWPNPAATATGLSLQLAKETNATIALYDENGKLVRTLYSGTISRNAFTLPVELGALASGSYFLAVQLPGEVIQKRVSVVR